MAKQLNVNLAFNADTSGAIKNLNELNTVLSKIGAIDISSNGISAQMKQAASSAQELQMHLNKAYDSKLGNLNLSKFEQSLKSSSTSLSKLSTDLLGAGRNGEQAFLRLQSSIASANTQLIQSQGLLSNFLTSLKNTARWQISSSILHGFMGTIQSAYSYSQRLNESLNNIRIVTGQSVDQMAAFAEQANKAAKALGTSTTEYTNASLIYYQQGLKGDDVAKRTEVTVKMANVANKTAAEVSDQMTAVWNNFYDGSKSLEYYADVMTALGAATASSTDEIAGGLEKFAAIADTIGLSYEYAAAALATITSNTRQSEEVVGTALKTIFARIQGLNLGETLDDGTTLNKYSEALQKVGISIFDSAGNLKDMDNILDEMGNKWEHLNKAQQTALAQTVAGTRQYTQLVALMDNWNKGDADSFQSTLATAYGAEGSLAEQHDIYLQGWEAAQKKVKAGFEAIYKELVPDEAFTDLYNGFADVLGMIEAVIKTMGGLEGVLMLAATVMLNKFAPAISQGIQTGIQKLDVFKDKVKTVFTDISSKGLGTSVQNAFSNGAINTLTTQAFAFKNKGNPYQALETSSARVVQNLQAGTAEIQKQQMEAFKMATTEGFVTAGFRDRIRSLQETTELTNIIKANSSILSKQTTEELMEQIRKTQELGEQRALLADQLDQLKNSREVLLETRETEALAKATNTNANGTTTNINTGMAASSLNQEYIQSLLKAQEITGQIATNTQGIAEITLNVGQGFEYANTAANTILQDIIEVNRLMTILDNLQLDDNFNTADEQVKKFLADLEASKNVSDALKKQIRSIVSEAATSGKTSKQFKEDMQGLVKSVTSTGQAFKLTRTEIQSAASHGKKLASVSNEAKIANQQYANSWKNVQKNAAEAVKAGVGIIPGITRGLSSLSSVAMSVNMISNAIDTLGDSSASFTQKLSSGIMAASMAFSAITSMGNLFKSVVIGINSAVAIQNSELLANNVLKLASVGASKALNVQQTKEIVGTIALGAAKALENKEDEDQIKTSLIKGIQRKLNITGIEAETLAETILNNVKSHGTNAIKKNTAAKAGELAMTDANTKANWKEVASLAAKNWWLLLIIAALAILVGGIVAVVNARKAEVEANKKSAEADREAAEALKEEAEANRELANSYREALQTYEETGEGKEECREAALAAAEAYEIEGAEILILQGRYKELNALIREKQKLENNKVLGATEQAVSSTTKALTDALREGDGHKTASGGYYGQFDNGFSNADEQAAYQAVEQGNYQYLQRAGGEISFNIEDISSPEQVYAYYQELEQFLADQRRIADEQGINLGASEIYQDALEEYNSGLEYYNQLKELMGEADALGLDNLALSTTTDSGKGINEISSLQEYENFYKNYMRTYEDMLIAEGLKPNTDAWDERIAQAETYLGTLDGVRDFYLESKSFESITTAENADEMEKIKEYYNSLSEEDQALFWTINIDDDTSLQEVQSAMELLQEYADTHGLVTTIKVTTEMQGLLEAEEKDWAAIRKAWDEGHYGGEEEWLTFLAMNDEDRINFVEGFKTQSFTESSTALPENIDTAEQNYRNAQGQQDQTWAEIEAVEDEYLDVSTRHAAANEQVSGFYRSVSGNTTDDKRLDDKLGGDAWGYLAAEDDLGRVNLTDEERRLVDAMASGDSAAVRTFVAQNVSKDDQYIMEALYGETGSDYVQKDADGNLYWTNAVKFKENGALDDGSWSAVGDALLSNPHNAAVGLIRGDSFATSREQLVIADDLYQEKEALEEELGSVSEGTGLRGELADDATTTENARKQYEQLLKDQAEWDDAFEADTESYGLDSDVVNDFADDLINLADTNDKIADDLDEYPNRARLVSQGIQRMNKGVADLTESWEDYSKELAKGNISSAEYQKSMKGVRDITEDLLDMDMSQFSDEWFLNNKDLYDRIANGDLTAIDDLRESAAHEVLINGQLQMDTTQAQSAIDQFMADTADAQIGTTLDIDTAPAMASLWDLYDSGVITATQLQDALNAVGWEPEVTWTKLEAGDGFETHSKAYVLGADGQYAEVTAESYQESMGALYFPSFGNATYRGSGANTAAPSSNKDKGGGGGGSKPKLKNDSDKTRYHTLENQLEDLKSEYDDISEAVDRAFGKDKLKLMDEQIAKTDELIDKQEEYVAAIAADLPKDKAIMEAYYDDLIGGPAIEFDENGNIANYDAIQDAMYAMYNENAENMSAEDWEVFEQKYEQLEKYIEQYEETYDMLRDEEQELQDLVNQRLDQELAKIQYTIELKMNVADDALEVLEYQLGRLEDDAFAAAEAIALLGDKAGQLQNKMAAAREGIDSILGQSLSSSEIELFMSGDASVLEGKTFTEEQMNQLREYRSELLSLNEELLQVREDVQSKVMETFDAWNEKLQKGIEKFDHYSSVLTSYKNIVDLVGKSYLGVDNELLKSMNDAMIENSINKVGATRAAYEALLESQANAQAQYEAAVASGNENDIKFWSDTLEAIGEEVDAAQENMMAAWEESLQLAAEEFQRQVDVALEEFNTALTGFASMEEFRENFDFAKEVEEEYVPAYEKIYELSKLNRDINKTLNDDRVIKGKEKLLELQEKINQYQQDGVEMSEYEIANLQREYDLRMAEIALEEARNAKDTVRMSKDNEGNWSYVYTTNTEAVDTAQQEYEDALFAMQQANDEYLDEMSNLILDATQRMNEEIAALRLEDFANQQEYDAAVQAITDKYMGRIKYGQEQMQLAINNNADLYQNDWTAYSEATGYKIATDEEYVDSFNETVLGKLLNSESQVVNVYDMINGQIGGLLEATSGAYADWSGQVDAANQAAGTSTDGFAEDMNNAINGPGGISESSGDAADSVYDMAEDMIGDFDRVAQAVSDWQRSYSNDIDAIIEKNLDAIEVCNALLAVLSDVQDVDLSNLTPTYDPYGKTYDNTTNSKDKDEEVVVVPVEQRDRDTGSSGGGGGRDVNLNAPWRREASVTHFASGGYTGEWGDDGRLAVLHQKELVLNAEDTANMFKALNLTRQILDTIDLNAQYASGGLGQVMASSIRDAITQTLDQHVTIEADFPSVTDHNEIEIAMKNLINTASQFAHRK